MPCKYCKEPIAYSATVCSHCSKYQVVWRNELIYYSSVAALVLLALSGSAFIINQSYNLINRFAKGDDVRVAAYLLYEEGVIQNVGYRPLNILRVSINIPKLNEYYSSDIYKTVEPGELIRFDTTAKQRHLEMLPLSKIDIQDIKEDSRIVPVAAAQADPHYILRKQKEEEAMSGDHIQTYPCQGSVVFTGGADESEQNKEFDCRVFFAVPDVKSYLSQDSEKAEKR